MPNTRNKKDIIPQGNRKRTNKAKVSKRKEITKMRVEINAIKNIMKKINKTKHFLKDKIDKILAKHIRKKRILKTMRN